MCMCVCRCFAASPAMCARVACCCLLLQVHLLEPEKFGQPSRLQTEGINFPGVWQQQALLDVDAIACNDVHSMLTVYGVEAARATILREVQVCDVTLLGVCVCPGCLGCARGACRGPLLL
eukprot:GHRQ01022700.1.p3 GENE.GHRQ01022700.1~~GHRQ01022700.1.p3  ORF type:complete len:120 (-),score=43.73 GHRQ01022700.1:435-794(-)